MNAVLFSKAVPVATNVLQPDRACDMQNTFLSNANAGPVTPSFSPIRGFDTETLGPDRSP